MTGFRTPIYFINESIILKMNPFVWFASLTVVLLFKDGSNILHVILTYILLFILLNVAAFQ